VYKSKENDDVEEIASNLREMGIDIDGLYAKVQNLIETEKASLSKEAKNCSHDISECAEKYKEEVEEFSRQATERVGW
jgi:hypothetical protein